ncbi:MAG TPA: sulfatase [Melioribacteraceae bacterium]|nr:sulfatase [Melioribacteraceae bacterium]
MENKISRSKFIKTLALGTAAVSLPGFNFQKSTPAEKPNILFIISDDLNDWVGVFGGNKDTITPNIDRLAKRSVIFNKAYCSAPICNPSRASMMTGFRPSTTGVYNNRQPFRLSEVGKDAVTLPQYLRENGYYATGAGKIYHGKFPDPASWNDFYPSLDKQTTRDPNPPKVPANSAKGAEDVDWYPLKVDDSQMGDYKTVEYCIEQLNKKHNKPFFLACGIRKPHLPWYVPEKYFDKIDKQKITMPLMREDDLDDVPDAGRKLAQEKVYRAIKKEGKEKDLVAAYLAAVNFTDTMIGRLIDELDKSSYSQNTIVILLGDHGWHLTEKLHWKKSTLWEEATRAPLMISVPGNSPKNVRCERTVSFLDLYPTIVELCGLKPNPANEGQSIASLLKNPEAEWKYPAVTTHMKGNHSVRNERYRYIRYNDGTEELYDHGSDEMEWKNLAWDPEYSGLKEEMKNWLPKTNAKDSKRVKWPGDKDEPGSEDEINGE